jgi:hypothetical protein
MKKTWLFVLRNTNASYSPKYLQTYEAKNSDVQEPFTLNTFAKFMMFHCCNEKCKYVSCMLP